jgi:hypothetical protein
MKRIILDHFGRWKWAMLVIFPAYFFLVGKKGLEHGIRSIFILQTITLLSFSLLTDLQRGLPRVLGTLPVTNKQIGRAWWLIAVALPAIALGVIGCLGTCVSNDDINALALKHYFTDWSSTVLFLGALFGTMTFMANGMPETFTDRIRTGLLALPLSGFILVQMKTLSLPGRGLILVAFTILSVLGWFRAERMVVRRSRFRVRSRTFGKQISTHKPSQWFGGLTHLIQKIFVRAALVSGGLLIWLTLITFFLNSRSGSEMTVAMQGGLPFLIFGMAIYLAPLFYQMRFLRTMPVSPLTLAGILVCVPLFSIMTIGAIFTGLVSLTCSEATLLPIINAFLVLGTKVALMVSLLVWRGLDAVTYLFIFLLAISGNLISIWFSKRLEFPLWLNLGIFSLYVIGSICLTRILLDKSSRPYCARAMLITGWGMARS